jgi:YidC/Oxa1 family membrane protein insertase
MAADGAEGEFCTLRTSPRGGTVDDPEGTLYEVRLAYPRRMVAPGESTTARTLAYLGPKDAGALAKAGHALNTVLDLGFFSIIASGMVKLLSAVHSLVGNWGLAILVMTICIKIVLFPLTLPQIRSMARMRALKPELDKINAMYAEDREKRGAATMELYRKFGINPVSGCLPALMQLPVWWALYTSLSTNIALYHEPFFGWLTDLSSPDPYFVMPVLLGILMWVQQRLTPTTMDPTQAKIMQWLMPIMITSFMLFLPQGLTVYMLTNSALSIGQQQFMEWRIRAHLAKA